MSATIRSRASARAYSEGSSLRDTADAVGRYLRRNPSLIVGLVLFFLLFFAAFIGQFFVNLNDARPISVRPLQPPSWGMLLGSDKQGRNLLAVAVLGTPATLRIGLTAGFIGIALGSVLAFVGAYYRGWVDALLRGIIDIGLTVPQLMVLIVVAMVVQHALSPTLMALIVASLAWLYPARTIRAQVLTIRERSYVQIARLSGLSGPKVIFQEILPNLLPYLAASLVNATSAAVLATIGLEVLGLGPMDDATIGMTIFWAQYNAAVINGWWWWWLPPIFIVCVLFVSLFLIGVGLDEVANPRIRRQV